MDGNRTAARGGGCSSEDSGNRELGWAAIVKPGARRIHANESSREAKEGHPRTGLAQAGVEKGKVLTGFNLKRVASDAKFKKDAPTGASFHSFGRDLESRDTQ